MNFLSTRCKPGRAAGPAFNVLFADHKTLEIGKLGKLLADAEGRLGEVPEGALLLLTCQRCEIYSFGDAGAAPEFLANISPVSRLSGRRLVRLRLASIAAGIESMLLGDGFVAGQIRTAANRLHEGPLRELALEAVALGEAARLKFDFRPAQDYPQIALSLLAELGMASTLVVVGSGRMGRAILSAASTGGYQRLVLVSRRADQWSRHKLPHVSAVKPEQITQALGSTSIHAAIAVTEYNPAHRDQVRALVTAQNCSGAVDLSSELLFEGEPPLRYIHEFSEQFCQRLRRESEPLRDLSEEIRRWLEEQA